jgi:hypothetical protein
VTRDRAIVALRDHGIVNPIWTYDEAKAAKLPLALACAILDQESGGGHNEWGHDPTIFVGAGKVTRWNYLRYKIRRRLSGNRLMQGCGPVQLTWWAKQDRADSLGGCWQPRFNMRVGFEDLAGNIRRDGLHAGIAAYNGSGPAAQRYADSVLHRRSYWEKVLPK